MIEPAAMALAGGAGGGALSQLLDALSAPRRALWGMLGGPEQGNQLVSKLTGADENGALAKILGTVAEIALDPMTYAGGAVFGKLGNIMRGRKQLGMAESALGRSIAPQAGEIAAAEEMLQAQKMMARPDVYAKSNPNFAADLVGNAAAEEERLRAAMRGTVDLEGLAKGGTRTYKTPTPEAARMAEQTGVGQLLNPEYGTNLQMRGMKPMPPGFSKRPDAAGVQGVLPEFLTSTKQNVNGPFRLHETQVPPTGMNPVDVDELERLVAGMADPADAVSIHARDPVRTLANMRASASTPSTIPLDLGAVSQTHDAAKDIVNQYLARAGNPNIRQLLEQMGAGLPEAAGMGGMGQAAMVGGFGGLGYGLGSGLFNQRR